MGISNINKLKLNFQRAAWDLETLISLTLKRFVRLYCMQSFENLDGEQLNIND